MHALNNLLQGSYFSEIELMVKYQIIFDKLSLGTR